MARRSFIKTLDDGILKTIFEESISKKHAKEKLKEADTHYSSEFVNATIERLKIDISHFSGRWNNDSAERFPIEQYLVKNSHRRGDNCLKKRLWKLKLLKRECYWCKLTEWRDQLAPLELDHINGDSHDNRLVNLRILCPNCHAQTETANGKNTKKAKSGALRGNRTHDAEF